MGYKFSQLPKDIELSRLFQEAQDNLATQDDVAGKLEKTIKVQNTPPVLKELSDGDEKAYYDGSNYHIYRRINGKLFSFQLTEV